MPSVTLTLSNSAGPYNLYNCLTQSVAGCGVPAGALRSKGMSVNVGWLKIQNELANTGPIRIGSDTLTSVNNKNGYPVNKGGEWTRDAQGFDNAVSLIACYISVSDSSQLVSINWGS